MVSSSEKFKRINLAAKAKSKEKEKKEKEIVSLKSTQQKLA